MLATKDCTSVQTDLDGVRHCAVGCRAHHKMPDGCVAADQEVLCACSNFECEHNTTRMSRWDAEEEYNEEVQVCEPCMPFFMEGGWRVEEQ
jgi:hypothetical protein